MPVAITSFQIARLPIILMPMAYQVFVFMIGKEYREERKKETNL
jgi:hypothetical protein